jgi:hypothetical protein
MAGYLYKTTALQPGATNTTFQLIFFVLLCTGARPNETHTMSVPRAPTGLHVQLNGLPRKFARITFSKRELEDRIGHTWDDQLRPKLTTLSTVHDRDRDYSPQILHSTPRWIPPTKQCYTNSNAL